MSRIGVLLVFLLITVGGGLLIGFFTAPGEWYSQLAKPSFTPPPWVFGPVWTVLYILVAFAGWRVWQRARLSLAMLLWVAQLVLNFAWSPVFFAAHDLSLALVIIAALLVAILAFIGAAWRVDRVASLLFVPYAAWVIVATALNASIVSLNP